MSNYEITSGNQAREWAVAESSKINQLHQECCEQDGIITDSILKKANLARECGVELMEYRKTAKIGELWQQSFIDFNESAPFNFSSSSADIYMRIARVRPKPITDITDGMRVIKEAMIATGSLFPNEGRDAQALHTFNFIGLLKKKTFDLISAWGKQIKAEPMDTWPASRVDAAIDELAWFKTQHDALLARKKALGGKV